MSPRCVRRTEAQEQQQQRTTRRNDILQHHLSYTHVHLSAIENQPPLEPGKDFREYPKHDQGATRRSARSPGSFGIVQETAREIHIVWEVARQGPLGLLYKKRPACPRGIPVQSWKRQGAPGTPGKSPTRSLNEFEIAPGGMSGNFVNICF